MLTASTPGAALFARTFSHASKTRRFSNFKRLQLLLLRSICRFLPRTVDLQTTVNCPAPSLRPHYRALTATTGRSAPVPRIGTLALAVFAACGSPSRGQKPQPSLSGRQVLLFHASACDELTPPIHRHRRGHIQPAPRLRAHRSEPLSQDHPQIPVSMPSLFRFDASAVVHTCSSSHRTPAPLTARRQPQRSPPRLLTDAACGGLESPPARRPRRTYLHHWHSTDRADDLLHHHHFPSGHTWVPTIRSWVLTRGFALHPGTRNRYMMRCTRTQHRSASRQVNDHGRVSGTHRPILARCLVCWAVSIFPPFFPTLCGGMYSNGWESASIYPDRIGLLTSGLVVLMGTGALPAGWR